MSGRPTNALTARSVVLSVLLGAHPAWASAAELVRLTADFDIREPTLRVALTRMVSAGDLVRSDDGYRLSERLLARQHRQDAAINPSLREYRGEWLVLVITTVGTDARNRASLRNTLQQNRFAELREGVWMRPDNLDQVLPQEITSRVRILRARDEDPHGLLGRLWDLPDWARTAHRLLGEISSPTDIPSRFVAAAAIVRHLLADPVLPDELLPPGWPGAELRTAYNDFVAEFSTRRDNPDLGETA